MDNFKASLSLEDYYIIEACGIIWCECGKNVYIEHDGIYECENCGRRYKFHVDILMEVE
jgi:hypothetical protein